MSRASNCLFSPPIFPTLAIDIDESGFVWRRCFLASAMMLLLRAILDGALAEKRNENKLSERKGWTAARKLSYWGEVLERIFSVRVSC